jgi:hypothetical protein
VVEEGEDVGFGGVRGDPGRWGGAGVIVFGRMEGGGEAGEAGCRVPGGLGRGALAGDRRLGVGAQSRGLPGQRLVLGFAEVGGGLAEHRLRDRLFGAGGGRAVVAQWWWGEAEGLAV